MGELELSHPTTGFVGCCARCERPRDRPAAKCAYELPPSDTECHLIRGPNEIMLAAMSERISRPDRQVCDRLYVGPTAKMLAAFAADP